MSNKEKNSAYISGKVVIPNVGSRKLKLNVRKKPSLDSDVVGVVFDGTDVGIDIKRSSGMFYKVKTENGLIGYCQKSYVEVLP